MIINIASFGGRSHLLDAARELEKLGHKVRFYSYVPTRRAVKFGLKKESNYTLFYFALPFLILFKMCEKLNKPAWRDFVYYYYKRIFDYFTAWYMKPCDVFIGQSPMHVYSLKYAKRKFDAIVILERGTLFILEQIKILEKNPKLKRQEVMPKKYINYDLKGYEYADYVVVGAEHVKTSFLKHNFSKNKIFVNPYGVNLSMFYSTKLSEDNHFDIITVGGWRWEKGSDLLVEVCMKYNFSLLHVGHLVGMDFPNNKNMKHIDAVDEKELLKYYSQAKVFVLPSRYEGLALVQAQAIACGLPVVCSKNTGGKDLVKFLKDNKWVIEMEEMTVDCLGRCIKEALELSKLQHTKNRDYAGDTLENNLTWEAYGKRYNAFLESLNKNI